MRIRALCGVLLLASCGDGAPVTPPSLVRVSAEPRIVDFGVVAVGDSSVRSVTLANLGYEAVELEVECDALCGDLPDTLTLASGERREVRVGYTPSVGDALDEDVRFWCTGRVPCVASVHAVGSAAPKGDIEISDPLVDFGLVAVGLTGTRAVLVTNTGDAPVPIELELVGDYAFTITTATTTTLAPGDAEIVRVQFAPASGGAVEARLDVQGGVDSGRVTFAGIGEDAAACAFEITPPTLSFGVVEPTRSLARALEFENTGWTACHFDFATTGDAWTVEPAEASVAVGTSQVVVLSWTGACNPGCAGGCDGTFVYRVNGEIGGELALAAQAPNDALLIVPRTIDFGEVCVGDALGRSLTVYDTGCSDARIERVELDHPEFELSTTTLPTTVVVGQALGIDVAFRPNAPGDHAVFVTIDRSDTNTQYAIPIHARARSDCP